MASEHCLTSPNTAEKLLFNNDFAVRFFIELEQVIAAAGSRHVELTIEERRGYRDVLLLQSDSEPTSQDSD